MSPQKIIVSITVDERTCGEESALRASSSNAKLNIKLGKTLSRGFLFLREGFIARL